MFSKVYASCQPRRYCTLHYATLHFGGNRREEAITFCLKAIDFAEQSLRFFAYNDASERSYLLAAYHLALSGYHGWGDIFMRSFETACHNDYTMLHDFGAMAVHIATIHGLMAKAEAITNDIFHYTKRVRHSDSDVILYPEAIPCLQRYDLPHTKLKSQCA